MSYGMSWSEKNQHQHTAIDIAKQNTCIDFFTVKGTFRKPG